MGGERERGGGVCVWEGKRKRVREKREKTKRYMKGGEGRCFFCVLTICCLASIYP